MKILISILFLTVSCQLLQAQNNLDFKKFPFDVGILQSLSYKKDSIMPTFIEGKFYYINVKTNKKITDTGFDTAYPFVGRKSTIIRVNNKFGIIDRTGVLIVEPIYYSFQLWHTSFRENFVAFDNSSEHVFDLLNGKYINPGYGEEDPYIPRTTLVSFVGKNKKYGINKIIDTNYHSPQRVIRSIFDTIYLVNLNSIIAKKNNRIGIVNGYNDLILPFSYDDIILSNPHEYSFPDLIGLKRKNIWQYYKLEKKPRLILESKFKCWNMGEVLIKDAFGIYNNSGKYNILFYSGNSMKQDFDWISDNGTVAINNQKVYIIGEDGVPFIYYQN